MPASLRTCHVSYAVMGTGDAEDVAQSDLDCGVHGRRMITFATWASPVSMRDSSLLKLNPEHQVD